MGFHIFQEDGNALLGEAGYYLNLEIMVYVYVISVLAEIHRASTYVGD